MSSASLVTIVDDDQSFGDSMRRLLRSLTNMGDPKRNDGSIMRSDLDGRNMIAIVPPGGTFTPKQLQLEKRSGKLYWSDREGMRVMRANLDGSEIETLVDTSLGDARPGSDQRKWCVGIAVDTGGGKFYWTQKGGPNAGLGRIFRANIQVAQGQSAGNRRDIELLYDNLPEPIDLDLDPVNRTLNWTDRGDPPRGNIDLNAMTEGKMNSKQQMETHEGSRPASAEQRLKELGIKLPAPPEPFGTYVEAVQTGNLLFLTGMLPTEGREAKFIGRVGAELDVEAGRKAAHLAALNCLAVAREYLGSLDKVKRIVRLGVSVATSGDIRDQPKVADGASELLQDVFGKDKNPCRLVYGVASLPLGTPVELV